MYKYSKFPGIYRLFTPIGEYLPNSRKIDSFCHKIKEHRNCLSHVNKDKQLLQGEKNEEYAEILYSTIRVLIIKHLKGEI